MITGVDEWKAFSGGFQFSFCSTVVNDSGANISLTSLIKQDCGSTTYYTIIFSMGSLFG
jgi:hypothetical protein